MTDPKVFLERFAYAPGMGAFGRLNIPARDFSCFTVEQDWEENKPFVSCIPEGVYPLVRGFYNRGGYVTFELEDVPGRSLIKFHRGNTLDDLKGCIAPGMELGTVHGNWAVLKSTEAFTQLLHVLGDVDATTISISSVFHVGRTGLLK